MNDLNLQYEGFLNTPNLWIEDSIFGIKQFELQSNPTSFNTPISYHLRLGKLVERFVSHQLHQDESISVLTENIQIQDQKLTLGELDCIFNYYSQCIHLEIIYKFYLYDDTVGDSDLAHWIGPNRKDSLLQKLSKLRDKQLPLLYSQHTKPILNTLGLHVENIQQQVCFKAQLFVPLESKSLNSKILNTNCIKGFYIKISELEQFSGCTFYIPKKLDWLKEVQVDTNWKNYGEFEIEVDSFLVQKKSPLCWIKFPNDNTQKCFVVWW